LKRWVKNPKIIKIISRKKIEDVIFITNKRAFIKVIPPFSFGGYYLIKEGTKWKFTTIPHHCLVVSRNLQAIAKYIKEFQKIYGRLPDDLIELREFYPEIKNQIYDLFDDNRKTYRFLVSQNSWTLYSIGPDSKNNRGSILYNPNNGLVNSGDIVLSKEDNNKIFKETVEKFKQIREVSE